MTLALVVVLAAVAAGGVVVRMRRARQRELAQESAEAKRRFVIHAIELVGDSPHRISAGTTHEAPVLRDAVPAPIERVVAALVTAGLPARVNPRGFSFTLEPARQLTVTVPDTTAVTPPRMHIDTPEWELTIDVAHALVPLFGPLAIDCRDAAWLMVDGTRSVAALREELGKRYAEMAKQMLAVMEDFGAILGDLRSKLDRKP